MKTRNQYLRDQKTEEKVSRLKFRQGIESLKKGDHITVPIESYLNARVACSYYNRKLRPHVFSTELDIENVQVRIVRVK